MDPFAFLAVLVLLTAVCASTVSNTTIFDDPKLATFLGTLEQFETTANDVVFVLDESGSIGAERFEQVKVFTQLMARRLRVSSEKSRVAILPYGDVAREYSNYIRDSYGNNMCTLLKKVDELDYRSGGTATGPALQKARELLTQARPDSNKIVVLITDGQSNVGGSPVIEAEKLKRDGVVVFGVGVAEVNTKEVEDVATSLNHVYILTNFDYIKHINDHLKEAIKDVSWDSTLDRSLCSSFCNNRTADCCDSHASCNCGTQSGAYECVCDAGYHGSGHKNDCHKCPRGTYKSGVGNIHCEPCPLHSTTEQEGATSPTQCVCQVGFYRHGKECKAIECARLRAPVGGVLIPSNCSHTYGSQCQLRCQEGYCPHSCGPSDLTPWNRLPLQFRICLESGKWSGEPFHCQAMKCPVIAHPLFGEHNCSGSDFQFGSTCGFSCKKGYELTGSNTRHCLVNGSWTGSEAVCKEIKCDPLKLNEKLRIKPPACSQKKMDFNSVCQYHCIKGYSLTSGGKVIDGKYVCLANKTWSGIETDITCQDVSPPTIDCPKSITTTTDPYNSIAVVSWEDPTAEDNVFVSSVTIKEPYFLRKPYTFPIGMTKIVYEAFDNAGLSKTCTFSVTVLDKEPPLVTNCPQDISVYHENRNSIPIYWEEPTFTDNSGQFIDVIVNRKNGTDFSWGSSEVKYMATDSSGNKAFCSFTVTVKRTPCPEIKAPDEKSIITCDTYMGGQYCSVFCKEGYQFASSIEVPKKFYCGKSSTGRFEWKPFVSDRRLKFKFPIPDCSRIQKRSAVNASVEMKFDVDSCNKEEMNRIRQQFIEILKVRGIFKDIGLKIEEKKYKGMVCPENKGCRPENVNITCISPGKVFKRSVQGVSIDKKASLYISFSFQIYPNGSEKLDLLKEDKVNPSIPILKDIEKEVSSAMKIVYNLPNAPAAQVRYDITPICSIGQIKKNDSCVTCPAGTYKLVDTCIECPTATYQDKAGSFRCLPCPKGYTTYGKGLKSKEDCKAPCQPGSYSRTTFEPCNLCPLNTYQEYLHQKECLKCPSGLQTWRVGSNSSKDCAKPCSPGSHSDTGLEPCKLCSKGSYQEASQQKSCEPCSENNTTANEGATNSAECKVNNICSESQPCLGQSICIPVLDSYVCQCEYGTFGHHCELHTDPCEQVTCSNNGTCKSVSGNFTCVCPEGFEGTSCEINIDDCKQDSCKNGGKCIDLISGYRCECPAGYTGPECEINIDGCASNPCLNGGVCLDKIEGFKCCCSSGYTGVICEDKEDPCQNLNCMNGGSCISDDFHATCVCKSGFSGEKCETNVDECINYECRNNGSCLDGIDEASCQCPLMYSGGHCETELSPIYYLEFGVPMTSNFVKMSNSKLLYAITLSFMMRSNYQINSPTPVSYSYHDLEKDIIVDDALTLFDINRIVLYLHGQLLHTDYIANRDSNWHHYAVTWERNEGRWSFYVDGKVVVSGLNVGKGKYFYPGIFVLGQEQDSLGGTFSTPEAFMGDITEFNVWDYAMTEKEIIKLSSRCGHVGNIIPWVKAVDHIHGTVNVHTEVGACKSLGSCSSNDCHCLFSNRQSDYICKHSVPSCNPNPCQNNQKCISDGLGVFCDCDTGFEGKFCEIDKNECLLDNGNCSHFCHNSIGTYGCSCPEGMILSEDGLTCEDEGYCKKNGRIYLDGEIFVSQCNTCTCKQGLITCETKKCSKAQCGLDESFVTKPGSCCPECISYSSCTISDQNTVTTFNSSQVEIDSNCSYKLIEDCINAEFSVRYEILSDGNYRLLLIDSCSKIQISKTGGVLFNDEQINLPFENDVFSIESTEELVAIKSRSGLDVKWLMNNDIAIAVPNESVQSSCGLCGSYQFLNSTCDVKIKSSFYGSPPTDNSGQFDVDVNRKIGDGVSWGSSKVQDMATDSSGNKAFYNSTVIVKRTPCPEIKTPDETSIIACDTYMGGQFCSVFCKEGYHFASSVKVPKKFYCAKSSSGRFEWKTFASDRRLKFKFPIPDCSRIQKRSAVNASVEMKFDVDSCSKEEMNKIRKQFIDILKIEEGKYKGMVCPENRGCRTENVNITCIPSGKVVKRSVQGASIDKKASLHISFSFQIYPNGSEKLDLLKGDKVNSSIPLLKDIEKEVQLSVKGVFNLPNAPAAQVNHNLVPICSIGQIMINDSCVSCPAGTYKLLDTCIECPTANYQDKAGSFRCLPCPTGYTTYGKGFKSKEDCKAPCQPGSYSRTHFEPCNLCPFNTYQEYFHGKECLKCPSGLQTWRVGSNSSKDCAKPCSPGSHSDTGLEPCKLCSKGSYQEASHQKSCEPCSENATTANEGATNSAECKVNNICSESQPCLGQSICIPVLESYVCQCECGTFGHHCEFRTDPCEQATCSNNGTCKSVSGNYTCVCPEGFEGTCEINIDDCKPDVSPPTIDCPKSITTTTDQFNSTAVVSWENPIAKDNVFVLSVTIREPYLLRKPYTFPIGKTKIVYEAFDNAGLSKTCTFSVTVLDKEPPLVTNCPQDISVYHENRNSIPIYWEEPTFTDNSGQFIDVIVNRKNGTGFSWGSSEVKYMATDSSGNKAFCNFTVTVKRPPCPEIKAPDETSIIACDMGGQYCSVFCKEGYHFDSSVEVPKKFYCAKSSSERLKWKTFPSDRRLKFKFPIPDCLRTQGHSAVNASVETKLDVDSCSKEEMNKIRKQFIDILKIEEKKYKGMICPEYKGCRPENVNITCISPGKVVKEVCKEPVLMKKTSLAISINDQIFPNGSEKIDFLKEGEVNASTPLLKD